MVRGAPGTGTRLLPASGTRTDFPWPPSIVPLPKDPPADAVGCHPDPAVRARHVAVHERGHHEVARGDAVDLGADVLDDADELVADRPDRVGRLAPVVPEVRPADAAEHDAHDRVGRLLDGRVGPLADGDGVRAVEDRCSHTVTTPRIQTGGSPGEEEYWQGPFGKTAAGGGNPPRIRPAAGPDRCELRCLIDASPRTVHEWFIGGPVRRRSTTQLLRRP